MELTVKNSSVMDIFLSNFFFLTLPNSHLLTPLNSCFKQLCLDKKGPTKMIKTELITAQKIKYSTKIFFSKCDQMRSFQRIWSSGFGHIY